MRVKVCGITKAEQAAQLDKMGVEFAGFIFYPRSPRFVYRSMPSNTIKKIRGNINKVGVFVDAGIDEVLRTVDDCGLYLVQLHGNESPKYCEKISAYISVIKAFRLGDDDHAEWKIKDYYDVADMFMFDTETSKYGGSGKKFNWEILKGLNIRKPFFLSGGIGLDDAPLLQHFCKEQVAKDLFAVDINSKFELTPGIKDISMIEEFLSQVTQVNSK